MRYPAGNPKPSVQNIIDRKKSLLGLGHEWAILTSTSRYIFIMLFYMSQTVKWSWRSCIISADYVVFVQVSQSVTFRPLSRYQSPWWCCNRALQLSTTKPTLRTSRSTDFVTTSSRILCQYFSKLYIICKVKVIYNIWIYNLTKIFIYKLYFYNFGKTIINLFAKVMKTIFYTNSKLLTCAYEVSKIWENLIL